MEVVGHDEGRSLAGHGYKTELATGQLSLTPAFAGRGNPAKLHVSEYGNR